VVKEAASVSGEARWGEAAAGGVALARAMATALAIARAMVCGPAAAADVTARPAAARRPAPVELLDALIEKEIRLLFQSYEGRNASEFGKYVAGRFRTRDGLGFGLSNVQLVQSIHGDMRNLRDLNFNVTVSPPQYSTDRRQARVDLLWQRRGRFAVSGEEWIVRQQRTTLLFAVARGKLRLAGIEGDPLFGLTNAVGVLVVDRGRIDGANVVAPLSALNGRLGAGSRDLATFGTIRRVPRPAGVPADSSLVEAPVVTADPAPPQPQPAPPPPSPGRPAPAPLADVRITPADITISPNPPRFMSGTGRFSVRVRVLNAGAVPTGAFRLTMTTSFDRSAASATIASIPPGGSVFASFRYATPPVRRVPPYTITAAGDSGRQVAESDEGNNSATVSFITAP
jgi:hypothetical protein